jgi:ATP synthase F1 delta subunit
MSFPKKIVTAYTKSLFQNLKKNSGSVVVDETYEIGNITGSEPNKETPNLFFIGEELFLIRSLIVSSKFMDQFFKNPTYSERQKLEILLSIFPGLTLSIQSFLKLLAERSHLSLLPEISDEYMKMISSFQNSTQVKIVTASGLKEDYGLLLLKALRKITNSKEILLKTFYNPKILGGLIVEYNSKSIDASILKEFSLFFNQA